MKSLTNYQRRVQAVIIVLFVLIALFSALSGDAQATVKQTPDGNYIAVKATRDSTTATNTGKTYTDLNKVVYHVYVSAKGKYFIYRIAKTSGKLYKYYLPIKN